MAAYSQQEVQERLAGLPGWQADGDSIRRVYTFNDFIDAIGFVTRVALLAQAADHHPDIDIRYNRVSLVLSTHSEGGVTEKDFALATAIDARL
ncbi:MAG: 4a-hydroxytetrahydrobiopterin dehydratase [Firmicutes bacterium]|nr:4a-hydroxytetrahydrobiopterin dehydratase [Bacillota bacterium]